MSDRLEIRITGTNQSSSAFRQVTQDARSMGQTVEQAGNQSSRSLQNFNQRAAAFGAALGGATLLMGEFARSAADDQVSQERVEQSITNTGASLDEYSGKLDVAIKKGQQKAFSDDLTRDAVVKLNLATNDTAASLDQLGLVMDFSRAKGVSLATSAEVIGKVMGGNLGILARYGIQLDDNSTKEEALAAIQQRVAGQAQTYAETQRGQLEIVKDRIDEMTESWGAHAGAMQSVLMILPGLTAGYTALAGVVAGMGGLGAIAKFAGPAALVAGGASLAYGYSQDTLGTTQTNEFWNEFFMKGSEVLNSLIPGGDPYDTEKYKTQMATNQNWDAINKVLQGSGMSQAQTVEQLRVLLGVPYTYDPNGGLMNYGQSGGSQTTGAWVAPTNDEVLAAATRAASNRGMKLEDYIRYVAGSSGMAVDPVTGQAQTPINYASSYQSRIGAQYGYTGPGTMGFNAIATAPYGGVTPAARAAAMRPNDAPMEFDPSAQMARAGGIPEGGGSGLLLDAAANAEKATAALKETYGAYYDLVTGVNVAGGALAAFKATQDDLIQSQGVYSQQISEYSQQENALTAARDVLLERQAEGVKLSKEEQELLTNYPSLYERVTGGVEDATVAQGLLAAQYVENMSKGDELNQTMSESTNATSSLVDIIRDLILSLDGVPAETRARLELDGADTALSDLQNVVAHLNSLDGRSATFFVNEVHTGVSIGSPGGVGPTVLHGGVLGMANGGITFRGGEAGYEYFTTPSGANGLLLTDGLYNLPRGSMVTPHGASQGKVSGGGLHFNGPVNITVVANDPRQMGKAIQEWAVGSSRS